jgi:hypothetical protein
MISIDFGDSNGIFLIVDNVKKVSRESTLI